MGGAAAGWEQPAGAAAGAEDDPAHDHETVRAVLQRLQLDTLLPHTASDRLDLMVLHPVLGTILLALALLTFLVFQAVFAWAEAPMDLIKAAATAAAGNRLTAVLPQGLLRSLRVDGIVAGVGGVGLSGRSFTRCCRALPAPFPASWPRAPFPIRATGWWRS